MGFEPGFDLRFDLMQIVPLTWTQAAFADRCVEHHDMQMRKRPKNAQQVGRIGAAEAFIDERMALGRVAFSLDDLMKESGLSAIAAKFQLLRLRAR